MRPLSPIAAGVSAGCAVLVLLLATATRGAPTLNVAGSAALDYMTTLDAEQSGTILQQFRPNIALKVEAGVHESFAFSGKLCFGCHGFMIDRAYIEFTPFDELGVQVGRVPIPFGEFTTRHDPANHAPASAPLPYVMGDMARYGVDQFNLGVLPVPYVDNALVVFGNLWPTDWLQLAWEGYVTAGFKGDNDFDFIAQRSEYFVDNNRDVARGGRVLLTLSDAPFAPQTLHDVSLGGSFMSGAYDPASRLEYWIYGVDLTVRVWELTVRGELVVRRTDLDPEVRGYPFELVDEFFTKAGWYGEVEHKLGHYLELVYRLDGLHRLGTPLPGSELPSTDSRILRYTQGINVIPADALKLKLGYEYWWFSDFDAEHVVHVTAVGTF